MGDQEKVVGAQLEGAHALLALLFFLSPHQPLRSSLSQLHSIVQGAQRQEPRARDIGWLGPVEQAVYCTTSEQNHSIDSDENSKMVAL